MLYNNRLGDIHKATDCLTCPYFDKAKKKCNGLGKVCNEYDPITQTVIDYYTKLPLKKLD